MLKKWQREEITKTLTALSQLVAEQLETVYYIDKISKIILYNIIRG